MCLGCCGFEAFYGGGVSRAVKVDEALQILCLGGKANASLVKASPWPFFAAERF